MSPESTVGAPSETAHSTASQLSHDTTDSQAAHCTGLDSPYYDKRAASRWTVEYSLMAEAGQDSDAGPEPMSAAGLSAGKWLQTASEGSLQDTPGAGGNGVMAGRGRAANHALTGREQTVSGALDTMAGLLMSPLALLESVGVPSPLNSAGTVQTGSTSEQQSKSAQHSRWQLAEADTSMDGQGLKRDSMTELADDEAATLLIPLRQRSASEGHATGSTSAAHSHQNEGLLALLQRQAPGPVELDTSMLYSPATASVAPSQQSEPEAPLPSSFFSCTPRHDDKATAAWHCTQQVRHRLHVLCAETTGWIFGSLMFDVAPGDSYLMHKRAGGAEKCRLDDKRASWE
jgi:hypothetical protein